MLLFLVFGFRFLSCWIEAFITQRIMSPWKQYNLHKQVFSIMLLLCSIWSNYDENMFFIIFHNFYCKILFCHFFFLFWYPYLCRILVPPNISKFPLISSDKSKAHLTDTAEINVINCRHLVANKIYSSSTWLLQ